MYNKTKHVYSLTNNEQETQTDGQDTQWARFIDFEKGKYLFKIREGGDSHIIFIHVTCPSLKNLRKLTTLFRVFFRRTNPLILHRGNQDGVRLKSSELHCIKLSWVSLFNAWKQLLGGRYLKLSVVLFHAMTFYFSKCREIVSISSPCCRSDMSDLAYISQLIKGFALFPLHLVLYVKVGSSSCYLTCVKYLRNDVIITRTKQDRTKKRNATVYHLDMSL